MQIHIALQPPIRLNQLFINDEDVYQFCFVLYIMSGLLTYSVSPFFIFFSALLYFFTLLWGWFSPLSQIKYFHFPTKFHEYCEFLPFFYTQFTSILHLPHFFNVSRQNFHLFVLNLWIFQQNSRAFLRLRCTNVKAHRKLKSIASVTRKWSEIFALYIKLKTDVPYILIYTSTRTRFGYHHLCYAVLLYKRSIL